MELDRNTIHAGTPVYSSDDEHVGDVEDVGSNFIRARKGWFFVKERYIPFTAIARTDVDGVYLSVAKDQLDTMAWDAPPAETDGTRTETAGVYVPTASGTTGMDDTRRATTTGTQPTITSDVAAGGTPAALGATGSSEHGAGPQASTTPPAAFQEGSFEVRARREEITVGKQARVIEELVLTTQATERIQTIQETVRRTKVDVTEVNEEAVSAPISSDRTNQPTESAVSGTAVSGASTASMPEQGNVSEADTSKPQRRRRRRLR